MNRKTNEAGIRSIQNSKGTYFVSLPIALVRQLGWRERQKVVVELLGRSKLVIKDWKK